MYKAKTNEKYLYGERKHSFVALGVLVSFVIHRMGIDFVITKIINDS